MRLTPIEIRQHRFNTRWRGCDPDEVQIFLEAVVADFEEVVRENSQLRREAERLTRELESHRTRERTIQETLTTAQTVVDSLKRTAVKESEMIVSSAELRAEEMLRRTETQRAEVSAELVELRHVRERCEAELRKTLEGYLTLLESFRQAREAQTQSTVRELELEVDRG